MADQEVPVCTHHQRGTVHMEHSATNRTTMKCEKKNFVETEDAVNDTQKLTKKIISTTIASTVKIVHILTERGNRRQIFNI